MSTDGTDDGTREMWTGHAFVRVPREVYDDAMQREEQLHAAESMIDPALGPPYRSYTARRQFEPGRFYRLTPEGVIEQGRAFRVGDIAAMFYVPAELLGSPGDRPFANAFSAELEIEIPLDVASAAQVASMMGVSRADYERMLDRTAAAPADPPPTDLIDRIQQVIDEASPFDGKCMRCGRDLDPDGPSPLYCREQCDIGHAEKRTDEGFREHWAPDDSRIIAERGSPLWQRRQRAQVEFHGSTATHVDGFITDSPSSHRPLGSVAPLVATCVVITPNGGVVVWDIDRPPSARELLPDCTVIRFADVSPAQITQLVRDSRDREPLSRAGWGGASWHTGLRSPCWCVTCCADREARRWHQPGGARGEGSRR